MGNLSSINYADQWIQNCEYYYTLEIVAFRSVSTLRGNINNNVILLYIILCIKI